MANDKDFQLRKTPRNLSDMHYNPKQYRLRPQPARRTGWLGQAMIWMAILALLYGVFKYFGK